MNYLYLLKAMADETRLETVRILLTGKKNAGQIVKHVKKSQPNTSLAIRQLLMCGLLVQEKKGREIYYSLKHPEKIREFLEIAEELSK